MEKLYLEIFIPAINKEFDFIIPDSMEVTEIKALIFKALSQGEANWKDTFLYSVNNAGILPEDKRLSQLGIRNGSKLILI